MSDSGWVCGAFGPETVYPTGVTVPGFRCTRGFGHSGHHSVMVGNVEWTWHKAPHA